MSFYSTKGIAYNIKKCIEYLLQTTKIYCWISEPFFINSLKLLHIYIVYTFNFTFEKKDVFNIKQVNLKLITLKVKLFL